MPCHQNPLKSGYVVQKPGTQTQQHGAFIGPAVSNAMRDAGTVIFVASYLIYENPALFVTALADYMSGIEETVR